MALDVPTVTFEIGFGATPLATSPTWTDVSSYVRGITIKRGRSNNTAQASAGTLTVLLDNQDSRFASWNTNSPYSPDVKPMVPVRLTATYSATPYVQFYGHVESWPTSWPNRDAVSTLTAVDGFKMLAYHETAVPQTEALTGTRIGDYLDEASWPAGWRDLDAGTITVEDFNPNCESVLQLCQDTARNEDGLFFIDREGNAAYQDDAFRAAQSSVATYGDDPAEFRYKDVVFSDDDVDIWNEITLTFSDGSSFSLDDATSITNYGKRTLKVFDLHGLAGDWTPGDFDDPDWIQAATDVATIYLTKYKDPVTRIERLVIDPRSDPTNLFPRILTDDISTRVTVKRRAPGGASVLTQDAYIEGITIKINPARWVVEYELTPYA